MLRAGADWAERSRNWPRPVRNKQDRPVVVMMRSCRRGGGMSGSGAVAQGDEVAPAVRLFRPVTGHYPPEATFGPETGLAAGGRCQPTVHRSFSLVARERHHRGRAGSGPSTVLPGGKIPAPRHRSTRCIGASWSRMRRFFFPCPGVRHRHPPARRKGGRPTGLASVERCG
jgi:hypothetical protein